MTYFGICVNEGSTSWFLKCQWLKNDLHTFFKTSSHVSRCGRGGWKTYSHILFTPILRNVILSFVLLLQVMICKRLVKRLKCTLCNDVLLSSAYITRIWVFALRATFIKIFLTVVLASVFKLQWIPRMGGGKIAEIHGRQAMLLRHCSDSTSKSMPEVEEDTRPSQIRNNKEADVESNISKA